MLQQVKNSVRNVAFKNNKQQVCLTRDWITKIDSIRLINVFRNEGDAAASHPQYAWPVIMRAQRTLIGHKQMFHW
jgi:hypothetical protein